MEMPTHDELMNPTLGALQKLGGSASIGELVEQVVEALQPPQEIVQQLHGKGSQTELEYRLAWARTYLKKFGLVTNSERGVWALTSEGSNIQSVDPRHVVRFVQQQSRQSSQPALLTDDSNPDTFEEVEDATEEISSCPELASQMAYASMDSG